MASVFEFISNLFSNKRKALENNPEYISALSKIKEVLSEINGTPGFYISYTERESFKARVIAATSDIRKYRISKRTLGRDNYQQITRVRRDIQTVVDAMNQQFVTAEMNRCAWRFENIDGKALDAQQREAVVTDELHNLVVAGAGSGKTLTISGKVSYLCGEKRVSPGEILLITFTKKAAGEMTERINRRLSLPVEAVTFHKLGLDIISRSLGHRPDIYENLEQDVTDYFSSALMCNDIEAGKLLDFFAYYLNIPADLEKYDSLGAYIDAEHSADFESIKSKYECEMGFQAKTSVAGERMRSIEEVMIANYLYLHGVNYVYEREYRFKSDDPYKKTYRPDFYLPDYDLYLEHFGINERGACPWLSDIESKKYVSDMNWKRDWHKKNGTKLIETYSYFRSQGILLQKLEEILKANGVEFKPVDKAKILEQVYVRKQDRSLKEFTNLVCSFIKLYKANGYSKDQFETLRRASQGEKSLFLRERNTLFLSIVENIYAAYQKKLNDSGMIDFSDMIIEATRIITETKPEMGYKYIIIDEYQDTGIDRYKLVHAIIENTGAHLMCVGDDWQSIYRFTGSDISLFSSFEGFWGPTKMLKIENTYRNSQELIDIAGDFVMKNKSQIPKALKSGKRYMNPIQLYYFKGDMVQALARALGNIAEVAGEKSSVFLLGRTNYDIEQIKADNRNLFVFKAGSQIIYRGAPNLSISFLTVHKSKGLEADNVIIINMENKLLGFPNKISDDPLLQMVLSSGDSYSYAEERRLMYVALTRTKNRTYLLVPEEHSSEFIAELRPRCFAVNTASDKLNIDNPTCPRCKTGKLVVRQNGRTRKNFVSCSHFPGCDFRDGDLSIISNPVRCPSCGGYIVERSGKFGKFHSCTGWPDCQYKP